jgi:hypothetical protein
MVMRQSDDLTYAVGYAHPKDGIWVISLMWIFTMTIVCQRFVSWSFEFIAALECLSQWRVAVIISGTAMSCLP